MPLTKISWDNIVLVLSAGAYIPLAIGGWQHPEEINLASYSIWLILATMLMISSRAQGYDGWKLLAGFLTGNFSMLIFGLCLRGTTFNLGDAEKIVLYGLITTIVIWVIWSTLKKKGNPRILFLGGIITDVMSYYPQIKQYLLPHDPPSWWLLAGWYMWIMAATITLIKVEKLVMKIRKQPEHRMKILEESAYTFENLFFMIITVVIMLC
ncbi:MAG: hypothetical protein JWP09_128 [Candidatus Taylorbacteria bacterium]|nr:hypothetical protein [Candidatus Taylorbacteria bacterium]